MNYPTISYAHNELKTEDIKWWNLHKSTTIEELLPPVVGSGVAFSQYYIILSQLSDSGVFICQYNLFISTFIHNRALNYYHLIKYIMEIKIVTS